MSVLEKIHAFEWFGLGRRKEEEKKVKLGGGGIGITKMLVEFQFDMFWGDLFVTFAQNCSKSVSFFLEGSFGVGLMVMCVVWKRLEKWRNFLGGRVG